MQLTINLPDILPPESTSELIQEIEQFLLNKGLSFELHQQVNEDNDPWNNLNLSEIAVDTEIEDFAENHDYYLYGIAKKS
jgi:hypothetical protein